MIVLAYILVVTILSSSNVIDATIGVNWGRVSPTLLPPSMVVDLLLQNSVREAKVYNSDEIIIQAFGGSNIGLCIGVFQMADIDRVFARKFVEQKIIAYPETTFRYIIIESIAAFNQALYLNIPFDVIYRAIRIMQEALNEAGYPHIKAVIENSMSGTFARLNITKPSEAEFHENVKPTMSQILTFYKRNQSPFLINFLPISFISRLSADSNFAFFDNKSTFVVKDINGLTYTNVVEFAYDAFVWALEKLGFGDIPIVISQIGWPTDGYPNANVASAERFYKGFLPFVAGTKGTPKRPGQPIDIYIHSLTDEKNNPSSTPWSRHWGLYMSNAVPKYKFDLTGQGRELIPILGQGINRMPNRWCVFNGDTSDTPKVMDQYAIACANGDCTSLAAGGSCNSLSFQENVSYAFNMYFQFSFQNETICDFGGLADIVVKDPSRNGCIFPVEVVKGIQAVNYMQLRVDHGSKLHVDVVHTFLAIFLAFLSAYLIL